MGEIKKSYCGLCHPRCGLHLQMKNGRAVKVTGDPDHPISRGRICERAADSPETIPGRALELLRTCEEAAG